MESGWIVAISSISTIVATGLFSIWSKRIDAKQKVNEHKLTIRSAYVNKKIEAGQKLVGENNVRILNRHYIKMYLTALKDYKRDYEHLLSNHKLTEAKLIEISIDTNSFAALYYDIENLYLESDLLLNRLNELMPLVEPGGNYCQNEGYDANVDKAIKCVDELLATYHTMNKTIRDDLAKYDIL